MVKRIKNPHQDDEDIFIIEDGDKIVGNAFTYGFLNSFDYEIKTIVSKITWEEFDKEIENVDMSYMGHEDTAIMTHTIFNRVTIRAKPGVTIILAQYDGPRLPEGTTTLPEGAKLTPLRVKVDYSLKGRVQKLFDDIKNIIL